MAARKAVFSSGIRYIGRRTEVQPYRKGSEPIRTALRHRSSFERIMVIVPSSWRLEKELSIRMIRRSQMEPACCSVPERISELIPAQFFSPSLLNMYVNSQAAIKSSG